MRFVQRIRFDRYDPTIEDCFHKAVEIGGSPCTLEIIDTAGPVSTLIISVYLDKFAEIHISFPEFIKISPEEITLLLQEEYIAFFDSYIRTGQVFVLVYSITFRSTFEYSKGLRSRILKVREDTHVSRLTDFKYYCLQFLFKFANSHSLLACISSFKVGI